MAPQWIEVHHLTGMPLDPSLWLSDPPASSLPACLAFKAAEQQDLTWENSSYVYCGRLRWFEVETSPARKSWLNWLASYGNGRVKGLMLICSSKAWQLPERRQRSFRTCAMLTIPASRVFQLCASNRPAPNRW